jgi:signal transduction histidine kinase
LALVVRDTGSGIAPEHVQNIFARFYRVSESREQDQNESGLGLAIAQSIVTAHGGRIFAESTLGQGTAIHIHMPYVNDVAHS